MIFSTRNKWIDHLLQQLLLLMRLLLLFSHLFFTDDWYIVTGVFVVHLQISSFFYDWVSDGELFSPFFLLSFFFLSPWSSSSSSFLYTLPPPALLVDAHYYRRLRLVHIWITCNKLLSTWPPQVRCTRWQFTILLWIIERDTTFLSLPLFNCIDCCAFTRFKSFTCSLSLSLSQVNSTNCLPRFNILLSMQACLQVISTDTFVSSLLLSVSRVQHCLAFLLSLSLTLLTWGNNFIAFCFGPRG